MAITFRQLRHFLALSQELHFGRAAAKLHVTQPPLSASLKQLEEELGFALMERTSKSVRLTSAGAVFADHAARILGGLDRARAMAGQVARSGPETLTVSFVPSMLFRHLPATLRHFQEACPSVELVLTEMNTTRQIESVVAHEVDVAFIHAVPLPEGLDEYRLARERLVACVPQRHRLAGRSRIALTELAGERVILFSRNFAAHYYDHIKAILAAAQIEPWEAYRIQHWFTVLGFVAQGMGVSLVPGSLARSGLADLAYLEIEGAEAEHDVAMVWRSGATTSPTSTFVHFLQAHGLAERRERG